VLALATRQASFRHGHREAVARGPGSGRLAGRPSADHDHVESIA